jgi:hypothetical protein
MEIFCGLILVGFLAYLFFKVVFYLLAASSCVLNRETRIKLFYDFKSEWNKAPAWHRYGFYATAFLFIVTALLWYA